MGSYGMAINWDALGAIGEVLGSFLVLFTLVYLAIQTRSISKQSKTEARYTFVAALGDINLQIAQNPQTASVWRNGLDDVNALTEDERMQFFMFMGQYCNFWSVMFKLDKDGTLPEDQWVIVRNDLVSILGSAGGRHFWDHGGRDAFDDAFASFVDEAMKTGKRSYDMAMMTREPKQPDGK